MKKQFYILLNYIVVAIVCYSIFLSITFFSVRQREMEIQMIEQNPEIADCKLISMRNYKGASIEVEYWVNNQRFTHSDGVAQLTIYKKYYVGQILKIKYCKYQPNISVILNVE